LNFLFLMKECNWNLFILGILLFWLPALPVSKINLNGSV
jgi:hypothetical protein